jgi:hypothetical protein
MADHVIGLRLGGSRQLRIDSKCRFGIIAALLIRSRQQAGSREILMGAEYRVRRPDGVNHYADSDDC